MSTPPPTPSNTPALTWQKAKAISQAFERDIVAQLPPANVASIDQHRTGTLLSCTPTTYQWAGRTIVMLRPGTYGPAEAISNIRQHWQNQPGLTVIPARSVVNGSPQVTIMRGTTENYIVGVTHETGLTIESFSNCFTLPEDADPGADF